MAARSFVACLVSNLYAAWATFLETPVFAASSGTLLAPSSTDTSRSPSTKHSVAHEAKPRFALGRPISSGARTFREHVTACFVRRAVQVRRCWPGGLAVTRDSELKRRDAVG